MPSKVADRAAFSTANQPKYQILFHKKGSPHDLYKMTFGVAMPVIKRWHRCRYA